MAGDAQQIFRNQKPMEGTSVIARQREVTQRTRRWSKTLKSAGTEALRVPLSRRWGGRRNRSLARSTRRAHHGVAALVGGRRTPIDRETGMCGEGHAHRASTGAGETWLGEPDAVSAGRSHRLDGAEVPRPGVRERSRALDPSASTRRRASGGNPEPLVRAVRRPIRDGGSIRGLGRKCPEQPDSRWIPCDAAPRLDLGRGLRGACRPVGVYTGADQSRTSAREGRRRRRTARG